MYCSVLQCSVCRIPFSNSVHRAVQSVASCPVSSVLVLSAPHMLVSHRVSSQQPAEPASTLDGFTAAALQGYQRAFTEFLLSFTVLTSASMLLCCCCNACLTTANAASVIGQ